MATRKNIDPTKVFLGLIDTDGNAKEPNTPIVQKAESVAKDEPKVEEAKVELEAPKEKTATAAKTKKAKQVKEEIETTLISFQIPVELKLAMDKKIFEMKQTGKKVSLKSYINDLIIKDLKK